MEEDTEVCRGGNCELWCLLAVRGWRQKAIQEQETPVFSCSLQMPYHKTEFRELSIFLELSSHPVFTSQGCVSSVVIFCPIQSVCIIPSPSVQFKAVQNAAICFLLVVLSAVCSL